MECLRLGRFAAIKESTRLVVAVKWIGMACAFVAVLAERLHECKAVAGAF